MNAPAINHKEPERTFQELMREWLQSYFGGTAHNSPEGAVTFDTCKILFNQEPIPRDGTPSIHCAFVDSDRTERPWRASSLTGVVSILASPLSGVDYILTTDRNIAEVVHGKVQRVLSGTDIRWQVSGSDLLEQTLVSGTWTTQRTITGTTTLTWQRSSDDYLEKSTSGATVRTITTEDPLWDGALNRVCIEVTCSWFIRVPREGKAKGEHTARRVAAQLTTLLRDARKLMPLVENGILRWNFASNPYPLADEHCHIRFFTAIAELECFRPIELS